MSPSRVTAASGVVVLLCLGLTGCSGPSGEGRAGQLGTGSPTPVTASPATGEDLRVTTSVFQVQYRLDGSTRAGSAVGVDVPAGTTLVPAVPSATVVRRDDVLGRLRPVPDAPSTAGTVARSRSALVATRVRQVTAPVDGVARLSAESVRVDSPGLDVVVGLKPLQQLRYQGMPFQGRASVETVLGQREVPCVAVWVEVTPGAGDAQADGSAAVHCRLPLDVETAAGLPAVLTLTSARQIGVIAVPLIYVGLDASGDNYVVRVRRGATLVDTPVVVGSTDGVRRVVLSGLAAGDVVVPSDQA